jgi:outer membrane protein assembly factor BamB
MIKAPRRLLLNDEGSAAVHYLDLDTPRRSWSFSGPGRDLQLIGNDRVLRSTPSGFVELELVGGRLVREIAVPGVASIESARRLPNGNTTLLGNGSGGIFVWELDAQGKPLENRALVGAGLLKGRLVRHSADGTLLFCSDTDGKRLVHEADFDSGVRTLFQIPDDVPADSMLKALRVAPDRVIVSTGYAASLIVFDTTRGAVVQTIGGKTQPEPAGLRRLLSPNFFSGYQILPSGNYLVANWQGHGPSHGGDGYQLLMYSAPGELVWTFDQTEYPFMTSLNNVIALDGLDTSRLHDERSGKLAAV